MCAFNAFELATIQPQRFKNDEICKQPLQWVYQRSLCFCPRLDVSDCWFLFRMRRNDIYEQPWPAHGYNNQIYGNKRGSWHKRNCLPSYSCRKSDFETLRPIEDNGPSKNVRAWKATVKIRVNMGDAWNLQSPSHYWSCLFLLLLSNSNCFASCYSRRLLNRQKHFS